MVSAACVDMERVKWVDHSRQVAAKRIAVTKESVYVLDAKQMVEEFSGGMWSKLEVRKVCRVGVASNGNVAAVTTAGKLLMQNDQGVWHKMNHCFQDVAFGSNGEIYALGCKQTKTGYSILRYV